MIVDSPYMKNNLIPLGNSVLMPLRTTAAASTKDQPFKRKFMSRHGYTDNLKRRNERYHEGS